MVCIAVEEGGSLSVRWRLEPDRQTCCTCVSGRMHEQNGCEIITVINTVINAVINTVISIRDE